MHRLKTMYVFRGSLPRGNRGWMVQVRDKRAKFFSDLKNGGREAAFRKAGEYADELMDRTRVNPITGRFLHKKMSSGVFRFVNTRKRGNPAIWIALASVEPSKPKRRYFYVRKYGEKKAERLARRARADMVKKILEN